MPAPVPSIRPIILKALKSGDGYESIPKDPEFITLLKKTYEFLTFKYSSIGPQEVGIGIILIDIVPLMTSTTDLMQYMPATRPGTAISEKQFIKLITDIYITLLPMSVLRIARTLTEERQSNMEAGRMMNNIIDISNDSDGYNSAKLGQTGSRTLHGLKTSIRLR